MYHRITGLKPRVRGFLSPRTALGLKTVTEGADIGESWMLGAGDEV